MYDIRPLKKIDKQIQADIDKVLEKWEPVLNEAVKKQMKPDHKICVAMGTAFIENSKGEEIAEKFALHVSGYQYVDKFETAIQIKSDL